MAKEAVFNGLKFGREIVDLSFNEGGIAISSPHKSLVLERESIKNFSMFPSKKYFCFRVTTDENVYDFIGVKESYVTSIKDIIAREYGIHIPYVELERLETTRGNIVFTNSILSLQNKREIFSIPKNDIKQVIELDRDLEVRLDGLDIVFGTTNNVSQFLGNKTTEEICVLNGISCSSPRSRSTLIFFRDYFVMKGSSYDHSIHYSNICEIFLLPHDQIFYLVIRLDSYIVQGQTKYDSLVFSLTDKEVEITARDSRLRDYYTGSLAAVLSEIVGLLTQINIQETNLSFKCTSKVHEGMLYFLESSLQFLPKSINIPINEISKVEFSRINLSMAQAKTFDMLVVASKGYTFTGIPKAAFADMELFFSNKGIRIVSEVVEESVSSETEDDEEEDSDLSDILAEDEE